MSLESGRGRNDYITLIAVYHFVIGGLMLFGVLGLGLLALVPITMAVGDPAELTISLLAVGVGMAVIGIMALAYIIVGLGVLRRRPWARWGAIVLAILGLASFPIGTVAGALILIYFLGDEGRAAFGA